MREDTPEGMGREDPHSDKVSREKMGKSSVRLSNTKLILAATAAILWGFAVATNTTDPYAKPPASPAKAQMQDLYHTKLLDIMPPADWQPMGPVPPIKIQYLPKAMLPEACHLTPERLVGCSLLYHGVKCVIIVGIDESPEMQKEVIQHERAHCSGWTHPDD